MKQQRIYPKLTVTKKCQRFIDSGHLWIYAQEIVEKSGELENGEVVDVVTEGGKYIGSGFYSEKSKIAVRLLSSNANDIFDEAFFYRRIKWAIEYRLTVMRDDFSSCRLIFGEADGLPGVTIDKFENILVCQILSFGMDIRKDIIYNATIKAMSELGFDVAGIYERFDVAIRKLEGLEEYKGWADVIPDHPESTQIEITENGIKYTVDFENGQKTGFFLDQKYNRREVARIAKGKTVLDCFTHTGSFALNAAFGGAEHVTAVDISESAVEMAKSNAKLNGLEDKMDFVAADVFELLPQYAEKSPYRYDFIILDPPAFTKSRKTVDNAKKGYKEINLRAMKLLPRGGYFATCSCSHFMEEKLFVEMLKSAAKDAGVGLKQIEARQQAPDHPILWNTEETDYLKFYIFQVI